MAWCVVAYAGGTGGNFVGQVIRYMHDSTPITILSSGSSHANAVQHYNNPGITLSTEEIMSHPAYDCAIAIGHFDDIRLLTSLFTKVVYIDFNKNDVDVLEKMYTNLRDKADLDISSINFYKYAAGDSWPSYNEYNCNKDNYQWITDEIYNISHNMEWEWCIDKDSKNTYVIDMRELYTSSKWLNGLQHFLGTNANLHYANKKADEYVAINKFNA